MSDAAHVTGKSAVWRQAGQRLGRPQWVHIPVFLALTLAIGVMDLLADSLAPSQGGGLYFWPSSAFLCLGAIWFGAYGVAAAAVGPMLAASLFTGDATTLMPANILQAAATGWLVRLLRADPRLRRPRDVAAVLAACLGATALAAAAGSIDVGLRDRLGLIWHVEGDYLTLAAKLALGRGIPALLFVPVLLRALSSAVVWGPAYCQGWFGPRASPAGAGRYSLRLADLPIAAKLMLLIFAAGFLPLLVLGISSFAQSRSLATELASRSAGAVGRYLRQELERQTSALKALAASVPAGADLETLRAWLRARQPESGPLAEVQARALSPAELDAWRGAARAPGGRDSVRLSLIGSGQGEWGDLMGRIQMSLPIGLESDEPLLLTARVRFQDPGGGAMHVWRMQVVGWLILGDNLRRRFGCGLPAGLENGFPPPDVGPWVTTFGGRRWHCAAVRTPADDGWIVVAAQPVSDLTALLGQRANWKTLGAGLALVLCLTLGGALSRSLSDRMRTIAGQVREAEADPTRLNVAAEGRDEIGLIGRAINHLSNQLDGYIRRLKASTAEVQRLESEIQIARQLQESILPRTAPRLPGWDIAGASLPAREVGGDCFDWFAMEDGRWGLFVADASGKGLGAAMLMHHSRGVTRAIAHEGMSPVEAFVKVNHLLCVHEEMEAGFVTMIYGVLEPDSGRFSFASAGHYAPVLVGCATEPVPSDADAGFPLGIPAEGRFILEETRIGPGAFAVLYTDGVTEALNPSQEQFGLERLRSVLEAAAGLPADQIVARVVRAVKAFAAGTEQSDDLTIVVIKRAESDRVAE